MVTKASVSTWLLTLASAGAIALGACDGGGDGGGGGGGGSEGGCPDDLEFFQEHVYEPILAKECIVCHSPGGLASKSKLVLSKDATPEAMAANLEVVRDVASVESGGTSVLLLRPTGMYPEGHTGGQLIDVGSPEYEALSSFVDRAVKGKCDAAAPVACDGPTRGARLLRRLSRSEYDATIESLFGFPSAWGAAFGADTVVNGFDNNAKALVVTPLLAEQVRTAAEEIAAAAFASPSAVVPCDPAVTGESACAGMLIDTFGPRAFRRPLDEADRERYLALYTAVAAEDGFWEGAKAVVTAMLQSPHFLYRTELGGAAKDGVVTLTPHEIASELSYLFWGTMPDAELLDKAASGALASPDEIAAQAARLLADPRANAALDRFVDQWLLTGNVVNVPKDNNVYPELTPAIRLAMREEIRALFRAVVRGETPTLPALLSADQTAVSPDLATFYGFSGSPGADGKVTVSLAGTERVGILTLGGVLATHAHPADSSPIHRGKLVRTRVLCQDLPPPPAGFNVQPPPLDPSLTTRERYVQHASEEPCTSCHKLIDPIGFGFERFDGAGRYRSDENGKPIDVSGEIFATPSTNGAFDGTIGLVDRLAESPDTGACFSLQWLRFAYALEDGPASTCLAREVSDGFAADGQRIDALLLGLVKTGHFTQRAADEGASDPGSGAGGAGQGGAGGAGQGGAGGAGAGGGEPAMQDLAVTVTEDSHWATGSCSSVTVQNAGGAIVTWEISLDVGGTVTDVWNAKTAPDGAKVKFTGLDYNAVLDPGETASFGFCVSQ